MLESLIQRSLKNDRKAQKAIYDSLFGKMCALCKRYARTDEDAYEILNTGFLKVFRYLDRYELGTNFEQWVKTIMINTSLDYLRSTRTYREIISYDNNFEGTGSYNLALPNLRIEELYRMIKRITPMSQTVFNLYAIDGFSHKEIAQMLDISIGTSKWHLFEARRQLQSQVRLEEEYRAVAYG